MPHPTTYTQCPHCGKRLRIIRPTQPGKAPHLPRHMWQYVWRVYPQASFTAVCVGSGLVVDIEAKGVV